ncbi:MAG TPA: hypothetical protein PKK48_07305 [Phycisphaerae bacterium]|nr:hypothetical protein [Phycisphaerae bacterium]HPS52678.1 hypothetical protein [Phycisphaerae bacterium]
MPRRQRPPLNGAPYCGNKLTREVHNLDNEKPQCQIDRIIKTDNAVPYHSLLLAQIDNYRLCKHCIGEPAQKDSSGIACNTQTDCP